MEVWSGVAGASISASFSLIQVRHVLRSRSTAGLSDASWLLLTLSFAAWFTFGVLRRDWFQIATNAVSLCGACFVCVRIHRDRPIRPLKLALTGGTIAGALALQVYGGTPGSVLAVFGLTTVIRARQLVTVRRSHDVAGVGMGPWAVSTVAQVAWLVHGLSGGKFVVAAHAPFSMAANIALMVTVRQRRRELARSRQADRTVDPEG